MTTHIDIVVRVRKEADNPPYTAEELAHYLKNNIANAIHGRHGITDFDIEVIKQIQHGSKGQD